jgi:hypothetical protein
MYHSPDTLEWSYASLFGAFIGYSLHWLMSWSEWRRLRGHNHMTLVEFLYADPPGFLIGLVATIFVYFSLPLVGEWPWIVERIGFVPKVNFFSAAVTAYFSNSIAIKLRNMSRKIEREDSDDEPPRGGNGSDKLPALFIGLLLTLMVPVTLRADEVQPEPNRPDIDGHPLTSVVVTQCNLIVVVYMTMPDGRLLRFDKSARISSDQLMTMAYSAVRSERVEVDCKGDDGAVGYEKHDPI